MPIAGEVVRFRPKMARFFGASRLLHRRDVPSGTSGGSGWWPGACGEFDSQSGIRTYEQRDAP